MRTVGGVRVVTVRDEESALLVCRISQSNRQKLMPSGVVVVNRYVSCWLMLLKVPFVDVPRRENAVPPGANP